MNADTIRATLCETERRYYDQQAALNLGGIAIGTGKSFHEWIQRPLTPGMRYGCGNVLHFITVDVYCINSGLHKPNIPRDDTPIFAKERCIDFCKNAFQWPESWDIASQCGAMCVHLAAMNHKRVGIVGFCDAIDPVIDAKFREILQFWKRKDRVFVSLMRESAFDDLVERGL